MSFVDSHCHLEFPEFEEDLEALLIRAREAGVETLLSIGTRVEGWPKILALTEAYPSETYPSIYASIGLHPTDLEDALLLRLSERLLLEAQHPKVVAFGETGLDFYHENQDPAQQTKAFQAHIEAGLEANLPLIVHTRDAEIETAEILEGESQGGRLRGVIHCFTGSLAFARRMLDIGFYLSFSGVVTFKNAATVQEVAGYAPLNRILIETDAPFLAPQPFRGKRNEPAFVVHTAQKIAELRDQCLEMIGSQTTDNFFTLFSKAQKS